MFDKQWWLSDTPQNEYSRVKLDGTTSMYRFMHLNSISSRCTRWSRNRRAMRSPATLQGVLIPQKNIAVSIVFACSSRIHYMRWHDIRNKSIKKSLVSNLLYLMYHLLYIIFGGSLPPNHHRILHSGFCRAWWATIDPTWNWKSHTRLI